MEKSLKPQQLLTLGSISKHTAIRRPFDFDVVVGRIHRKMQILSMTVGSPVPLKLGNLEKTPPL